MRTCATKKSAAAAVVVAAPPARVAAPQDGFCSICEAIVGFVESYIEQNATEAQIQARLDAACALTGPYATECKALVDQYLPQIIQWVEKNETPDQICAQIGVCNKFSKVRRRRRRRRRAEACARARTLVSSVSMNCSDCFVLT